MQSKMTEKEFRQAIENAVGTGWSRSIADLVLPVVRAAELEFAPEPVELPGRLVCEVDGSEIWIADADQHPNGRPAICGVPASWLKDRWEWRRVVVPALVDRYNAYPGLREAAGSLVCRIRSLLAPGTQHYIEDETARLEASLAKGPK